VTVTYMLVMVTAAVVYIHHMSHLGGEDKDKGKGTGEGKGEGVGVWGEMLACRRGSHVL
jgi:hypothetical protein